MLPLRYILHRSLLLFVSHMIIEAMGTSILIFVSFQFRTFPAYLITSNYTVRHKNFFLLKWILFHFIFSIFMKVFLFMIIYCCLHSPFLRYIGRHSNIVFSSNCFKNVYDTFERRHKHERVFRNKKEVGWFEQTLHN